MSKKSRPIGVVGPGAVGSVLAASFIRAGRSVVLLGRAGKRPLPDGLVVTDPRGRRHRLRRGLKRTAAPRRLKDCQAVFFCVKSGDIRGAASPLKRILPPDAAVVGLQNGMGHERLLRRAFGPRRTVIGSVYFAASRGGPGTAAHNGGRLIRLAAGRSNKRAAGVARRLLRAGGWEVETVDSESAMLWSKLAFNASANPLGAICNATNGELTRDPALRHLMSEILKESLSAARIGVSGRRAMERLVSVLSSMPGQPNSMLQDLRAGRPTERSAILAPLIKAGRGRTPLLKSLDRLLGGLERSLR